MPRKPTKGKKKHQQKREWRADDNQLNKYVAFTVLSPHIGPYIAATFISAGPVGTVGHLIDRTTEREASTDNGGRLQEADRDPQQTRITRGDPPVAVPHPSTFHDADAGSTVLQAAARAHITGGAETVMHGGDTPVHGLCPVAPTVAGGRVLLIPQVEQEGEEGAGPGALALVSVGAVALLPVRGSAVVVVRCIAFQPALGQTYLRLQSYGFFGSVGQVHHECECRVQ